jgi:hypothetical protein
MSAHTPGPWAVAVHEHTSGLARGEKSAFVRGPTGHVEVSVADARLIAASPDLLAALKGLDEAFCIINEFSTRDERHAGRLALIAARAAIAKATGVAP